MRRQLIPLHGFVGSILWLRGKKMAGILGPDHVHLMALFSAGEMLQLALWWYPLVPSARYFRFFPPRFCNGFLPLELGTCICAVAFPSL